MLVLLPKPELEKAVLDSPTKLLPPTMGRISHLKSPAYFSIALSPTRRPEDSDNSRKDHFRESETDFQSLIFTPQGVKIPNYFLLQKRELREFPLWHSGLRA